MRSPGIILASRAFQLFSSCWNVSSGFVEGRHGVPGKFEYASIQRQDRLSTKSYFDFALRFRLIALQPHRSVSGIPRGVTCTQDWHVSHRKQASKSLKTATTGWKSFFPKLAHSL